MGNLLDESESREPKVIILNPTTWSDLLNQITDELIARKEISENSNQKRAIPYSGGIYGKRSDSSLAYKRAKIPFSGGIYGKRAIPFSGGIYGKRSSPILVKRSISIRSMPLNGGIYG